MEIRDLRFFCLTAELEHVTKAAEQLGVAQPFLTKIIGQMERELGVALFDNVGRKIKLNEYGEMVYIRGKRILTEMENLINDLEEAIDRRSHTIRVITNLEQHYPEMILAYQREHPDYTFALSYGSREKAFDAIRTGEADLAVCSPPLADSPEKGVRSDVVFREYSCVMLPPDSPLLGEKRPIGIVEDVGDMPLIATTPDSALRINLERTMEKYNYHPRIVCESNDINLIIRSVRSGFGFAIIPRSVMLSMPEIQPYCVENILEGTFGDITLSYSPEQKALEESGCVRFLKDFLNSYNEKYYKKGLPSHLEENEKD